MAILIRDRILDSIEAYFALSPRMLELSIGVTLPASGNVDARVSVKAAREAMLDVVTPTRDRNAIWSRLLGLAREKKEPWDVVAIWMMVPGLRKASQLCPDQHRSTRPISER